MELKKFKKVLVANRGEIAIRVFRALNELGITTVGVFSKEDRYALFRSKADESYQLNPDKGPIDAYLDINTIIRIAKEKNVDAIHPGYGFLSENPDFVDACEKNGITFIGPSSSLMRKMGDKISSKQMAIEADVPIIPGVDHAVHGLEEVTKIANQVGYPVMLKASNGGGGRGMRIVHSAEEMPKEYAEARDESKKAFGDDQIFVEKYLKSPKHIEVQIIGDQYGHVVHLYDRDCSVQRRHQKVVEYAPAFSVPEEVRQQIFEASIRLAKHVGYKNAGTLEFLVDADNNAYFIEMNPRVQVEHTITEMVTGIDIVQTQVLVAEGYSLDSEEIGIGSQEEVTCNGYSIQTRITTEDPMNNFLPDTGKITVYRSGAGNGIRLDGGNAYAGAEITPYYDSLLVKAISHDRTFGRAVDKSIRVLKEIRIRGVKTNIPFLINVLNNETFREGRCYTTFIEETPELFLLPESQDRATKILEFLGNKMVNVQKAVLDKPDFEARTLPKYDTEKKIYGSRDKFLEMGAKDFTQSLLNEKRLLITDTTMRDAQQSLMATRMRTKDLIGASDATNAFMENAFSVEAWGGATYDTAYRFLKESPWKRLKLLRQHMPNTLIQMLLRASNAVGYSNYPDNVVKKFIEEASQKGVDVFRIFDSLNWVENMKMPIETALKTGKIVEGTICYTGDITDPNETKYTLDYYVKKAKELESLGVHIFTIKDMAGLLKPQAAYNLVSALKDAVTVPIHLHTHEGSGNAIYSYGRAVDAGVDVIDLAYSAFANGTSQPSMNSMYYALAGTERQPQMNIDYMEEMSHYFGSIRPYYKGVDKAEKYPNTEVYQHEMPGGQYSNLQQQAKMVGLGDRWTDIKKVYHQVNMMFGDIIKVTPSSKVVGDMTLYMVQNNLTEKDIYEKGDTLDFPQSVVEFFEGRLGTPYQGFPEKLQKIILKGARPITVRPGAVLPPTDFEHVRNELSEMGANTTDEDVSAYCLYPKVFKDYTKFTKDFGNVSVLDTPTFFFGMKRGEEIQVTIEKGKTLIIKMNGVSDPDEDGNRIVLFEFNGQPRAIKVHDKHAKTTGVVRRKVNESNPGEIGATLSGSVVKILVKKGQSVTKGEPLIVTEAMKMETTITAPIAGIVEEILVREGSRIESGDCLLHVEDAIKR